MTKNRARLSILCTVLSSPAVSNKYWTACFGEIEPRAGDLVAMTRCAPANEWYMSWLHEINPNYNYLLESIENGAMRWWNVGLSYYDRERVASNPHWRWDDEQFSFNDMWYEVAEKNGVNIVHPRQAIFMRDGSVVLDVRSRFDEDEDYSKPEAFPNWREVTMKAMDEYYKKSVEEYEDKKRSEQ